MHDMEQFPKSQRFGFQLLPLVFGTFLTVIAFFSAPSIESTLMPVVPAFEVRSTSMVGENAISISGVMDKVRSCKPEDLMFYIKADDETTYSPAAYTFTDDFHTVSNDENTLKSRAAIEQPWGPWVVYTNNESLGRNDFAKATIRIYSVHKCHSFYDTYGKLHEFTVTKVDGNLTLSNKSEE